MEGKEKLEINSLSLSPPKQLFNYVQVDGNTEGKKRTLRTNDEDKDGVESGVSREEKLVFPFGIYPAI